MEKGNVSSTPAGPAASGSNSGRYHSVPVESNLNIGMPVLSYLHFIMYT